MSMFEKFFPWIKDPLGAKREVDVQYPLPAEGVHRVYVKDLNVADSDNGDFTGCVCDYFNDLTTVNSNTETTAGKEILIRFQSSLKISEVGFGCNDPLQDFSNIKIEVLGSADEVRFTYDATSDSTKRRSFVAPLEPETANALRITFDTTDPVGLSNLIVYKANNVVSRLQGLAPDGTLVDVKVTQDGDLSISDNSSGQAIAEGNVSGKDGTNKFGNAPDFDTGDGEVYVWDGANDGGINAMQYTFSTTADIGTLSSDNAADTMTVEIQGLDTNWSKVTQTATLNGQTDVSLTTNLLRVFRIKNTGSTNITGSVYLRTNGSTQTGGTPDTPSTVRAVVIDGNNQTEMAIYSIPAGSTGYIRKIYASTAGSSKTTNYVIKLFIRPFGGVFQLKHRRSINDSKDLDRMFDIPEVATEKSDVIITAEITAAGVTQGNVSAGFDVVDVVN